MEDVTAQRPDVGDNAVVIQKSRFNVESAREVLEAIIPTFPVSLAEPRVVSGEIEKFAQELRDTGMALVNAKMTLYLLERQKRATERALKKTGQMGNPAIISQLDLLNDVIVDANNVRFAALDKLGVLRDLLGALYQIKSAMLGGF